ncbi:choice-of-anchor C family protein [Streptomyces sp. NPDC094448]|uniref:choice-of-anchor C family protein n=1 Tax=Streptomyces sp. NPDC094448 TaxID=3366063 RepID=UPI00381B0ECA
MSALRACTTAVAGALALAAGCAVLAAPAQAAALSRFDDGSFEYPVAPANSFSTFTSGQSLGPWQVTAGSVDLIGSGFWQAAEGNQSVDLSGNGPGTVAQTFTTVPGTTYSVSYSLAGNIDAASQPIVKTGRALIDGQVFQDFTFDITGKTRPNMGYVNRQFTFVASAASTTLAFASTTAGAHGPVLDNVQVKAACCGCSASC